MKHLIFIPVLFIAFYASAQHKVTLKPHFNKSQDCFVQYIITSCAPSGYAHVADSPHYNIPVIHYMAWTFGGCFGITRSVIRFTGIKDTNIIPNGVHIIAAYMRLYSPDTNLTGDFGNSSFQGSTAGSNHGWCYETTDSFDATAVSWNTQPDIKHNDSVYVRESYAHWGDTVQTILVTRMVRDMYINTNTGFKLKLDTETTYRQRLFASGRFPDSTLHPELIIIYGPAIKMHDSEKCRTAWFKATADTSITSYKWYYGDGSSDTGNPVSHLYGSFGTYHVMLVTGYRLGFNDTTLDTITLSGSPGAINYTIADSVVSCKQVKFRAQYVSGDFATGYRWYFGDGGNGTGNPVTHTYLTNGNYTVSLVVSNATGCIDSVTKVISVDTGNFNYQITDSVLNCNTVSFDASYINQDVATGFNWAFDDGSTSGSTPVTHKFSTNGKHSVVLTVSDSTGCLKSFADTVDLNKSIAVNGYGDTTVCPGGHVQLNATGAFTYSWQPANDMDNALIADPVATVKTTTVFVVTGTDTAGCTGTDTVVVTTLPAPNIKASSDGKTINCTNHSSQLNATGGTGYTWIPVNELDNANIANPVASPQVTTVFIVTGTDANGCTGIDSVTVVSDDCYTIGVPGAFTPNGDGANDILYVRGYHIATIDFIIYNRWGNKVFESKDMNTGWDGTFHGMAQPIESYAYTIEATTYGGKHITQKGSVDLLR